MAKDREKTNVMRALERAKVPYRAYAYENDGTAVDGVTVAQKLGRPVEQVFKTLVTRGAAGCYVFVIPVAKELDLKAAARSVGEKALEMLHVSELNKVTGYVRGGCSPIGMKKSYPTVVDESCLALPSIIFSAGKIGFQVEVEPQALLTLIGADTAAVAV